MIQTEQSCSIPRIVNYQGIKRKYFFDSNSKLTHFLHYSSQELLIYRVVFSKKGEYAVYYFNSFEWITRIEYYRKNLLKTVTYFRPMKRALIIEYDENGSKLCAREY